MKSDSITVDDSGVQRRRRARMVEQQLRGRGVEDELVLSAMSAVPRHGFVPDELIPMAYADGPLPIGDGQTISQPYIVAVMSEALHLFHGQRVLEIGTGCGYQAAVLAAMGLEVFTVEVLPGLARAARERLEAMGRTGLHFKTADGHLGWPENAPFDGIMVTAAPSKVPHELLEQLAPGGRLVIPVGSWNQELRVYRKNSDETISRKTLFAVRFVPLVRKS